MTFFLPTILALLIVAFGCATPPKNHDPFVVIETNMGEIEVELFEREAPLSVENFLTYVDAGFYDGLIFHRVIDHFMIQGGGMTPDLIPKKGRAPIQNEAGNRLKNLTGTLAMARTMDPNSASSQFFINVNDNKFLDFVNPMPDKIGYAVFGKVIKGMDVVNKIKSLETGISNGQPNVPVKPIIIKTIRRRS